jgi:hypothetical protein
MQAHASGSKSPQSSLVNFLGSVLPQVGCGGFDGASRLPIAGGGAKFGGAAGEVSGGGAWLKEVAGSRDGGGENAVGEAVASEML